MVVQWLALLHQSKKVQGPQLFLSLSHLQKCHKSWIKIGDGVNCVYCLLFSFATLGHCLALILYVELEIKAHGEGTGN